MTRFLALFLLGFAALAEERPNPAILKWQAEAQAPERAINRRAEYQLENARAAQEAAKEKKPAPSTRTKEAQSSIIDTSRR